MTQTPFDQLAKQYLEEFLAPIGLVERQYEVPGETKFVDVWFVPTAANFDQATDLGLLKQMVQTQCLLEPFHNAPTRNEVRTCLLKLIWIQENERRKAKLLEADLPQLWILAATTSQPVIQAFGGEEQDEYPGVYFLKEGFKTTIVSIDRLPETEETLWLRVLGRDSTQERAIREVSALPITHPRRNRILQLLVQWKVKIDLGEAENFTSQETQMALSQAFLEWEQATRQEARQAGRQEGRQEERRSLILLLLEQRIEPLSQAQRDRISFLNLDQLQQLAIALLNFSTASDLETWLSENS